MAYKGKSVLISNPDKYYAYHRNRQNVCSTGNYKFMVVGQTFLSDILSDSD